VARGLRTRFTFDPADERGAVWQPGGRRIVFASNRKGHFDLYQKSSSGAGSEDLLLESKLDKFPSSCSPDGRFLLYQTVDSKTRSDLWVLPLSGDRKPYPFLQTEFAELQGRFSADGKWVAYTSNESGTAQVYVRSFPDSGGKWQISTNGGAQPQWRHDGKELFWLSSDRKLMAVDVKSNGSTFDVGVPKALFELRIQTAGLPGPRNFYVAAADGQRFLVASVPEERFTTPTTVVVNWTAGLKQ